MKKIRIVRKVMRLQPVRAGTGDRLCFRKHPEKRKRTVQRSHVMYGTGNWGITLLILAVMWGSFATSANAAENTFANASANAAETTSTQMNAASSESEAAKGETGSGVRVSGDKDSITQTASGNGIFVSKTLQNLDHETLQVTLENYTTGESITHICPADIVLVMDVSGSMWRDFDENHQNIQALRESATRFVELLKKQNENLDRKDQSRLALVQYSSSAKEITKELMGLTYVDPEGAGKLNGVIERVQAIEKTKTNMNLGLGIAKGILDEAKKTEEGKERRQIAILFTDGFPSPDDEDLDGFVMETAKSTLEVSKSMKDEGIKVYGVSIEAYADSHCESLPEYAPKGAKWYVAKYFGLDEGKFPPNIDQPMAAALENRFMYLLSSDNPKASDMDHPVEGEENAVGKVVADDGNQYYFTPKDTAGLTAAFQTVAESIVQTASEYGPEAEARDFVTSDYFISDLNAVKVYSASYKGENAAGEKQWAPVEEWEDLTDKVTIRKDAQSVRVNGFDYKDNYVSDEEEGGIHGHKLIIQFPIKSVRTFGGNQVPTNTEQSGVYADRSEEAAMAVAYPVPEADLEVNYRILAEDRAVYVPFLADLSGVVPYAEGYDPDGKLNQYVNIHYVLKDPSGNEAAEMDIPAGTASKNCEWKWTSSKASECGVYTVVCDVKPIQGGHYDAIWLQDEANVHVFHPQVLFQDSEQKEGDTVDTVLGDCPDTDTKQMGSHWKSIAWVCQDGKADSKKENEPNVKYQIAIPEGSGVENENGINIIRTTEDIPVVVGVWRVSGCQKPLDITAQTEFSQECSRGEGCSYRNLSDSQKAAGVRFLIHVKNGEIPVLPATGGSGTGGFLAAAILMTSILATLRIYYQIILARRKDLS